MGGGELLFFNKKKKQDKADLLRQPTALIHTVLSLFLPPLPLCRPVCQQVLLQRYQHLLQSQFDFLRIFYYFILDVRFYKIAYIL